MKIEVACEKKDSPKAKGDLLEKLSKDLLEAQGYDVIEEIRFTGVELDLLCKHRVSGKKIYVECKAQQEKIGTPILRQLLGTVTGYEYTEGWIISTSEFGKEAKGFVEMWKAKPPEVSAKLSFYYPELVLDALESASVICTPPKEKAESFVNGSEFLGDWSLLISKYGRHWAVYTLSGGVPNGVLLFNAENNRQVQEKETLNNISLLESSFAEYDLTIGVKDTAPKSKILPKTNTSVIEVQIGDSWDDYRPDRPQDFIGRDVTQKEIINFLLNAINKQSNTRIFAITGNSGLGKSSLIAKVRDRSRNKFYKKRIFTFAVDMRGAISPSYISASLLKCLNEAQKSGFGDEIDIQLTDPSEPISTASISKYLQTVERKEQVICLIFDQFEELYSKPELFGVFNAAKNLMLDVTAFQGNIVLGFAWKTDSTTHQDHPAYHMWHDLSDCRRMFKLDVFDNGEISKSITTFEKEIDRKIPIEIRHQILHSSQGFPWLIKKLCINLYENLKKGEGAESILIDLDVSKLFENDLELLSQPEHTCLKLIAEKAPADWSEILEISGVSTLNGLVHKRLVIKSGDRLNIYWDIFKDYLLTGNVPVVPFNYIPTSDLPSMLKVSATLNHDTFISAEEISQKTSLKEKTIGNIGADLVMLGVAERKGVNFKHHRELEDHSNAGVLKVLRKKFGKHSLKLLIYKKMAGKPVDQADIIELLKLCLPKSKYSDNTWRVYTNKLSNFFIQTGYFVKVGGKVVVQDIGTPVFDFENHKTKGKQKGIIFSATASPASVCEVLNSVDPNQDLDTIIANKQRNSLAVLKRFDLVSVKGKLVSQNCLSIKKYGGTIEAVWTSAKNEPTLGKCIELMNQNPDISGSDLGKLISEEYNMSWTHGSIKRNGNSLRQWACWVKDGIQDSSIPPPPGRRKT